MGLSAGQRRALARCSAALSRWRCTGCLADLRHPRVTAAGVTCPQCATLDPWPVVFERVPTRAGFRWEARILPPVCDATSTVVY